MGITVTKAKPKAAPLVTPVEKSELAPAEMTDEQLADAYGSLQDQIASIEMNPLYLQFETVRKELMTRVSSQVEPGDGAEIAGAHWLLEIGACSKKARQIADLPKLANFVGAEVFYKLASFKISDAEAYLTPEQLAEVVSADNGYNSARKITPKYLGK